MNTFSELLLTSLPGSPAVPGWPGRPWGPGGPRSPLWPLVPGFPLSPCVKINKRHFTLRHQLVGCCKIYLFWRGEMCFIQFLLMFSFLETMSFIGEKLGEQAFWVFLTAQWFRMAKSSFKKFDCEEQKLMSRAIEIIMTPSSWWPWKSGFIRILLDMLIPIKFPAIIFLTYFENDAWSVTLWNLIQMELC